MLGFSKPFLTIENYSQNQVQTMEKILNDNSLSIRDFKTILDFGCGYGRHLKQWSRISPDTKLYGCDPDENCVKKAVKTTSCTGVVNDVYPPLKFKDECFDFIYSYSVFTHLSEDNHKLWLSELARVLKPGGAMLHSVHGFSCLHRLDLFNPESLEKYKLHENEYNNYHFIVYNKSEYGNTIISKKYILKNWPKYSGLNVVDVVESAIESSPEGCHDLVLMKKREV
jgi:SAM-dependent methyltransferase